MSVSHQSNQRPPQSSQPTLDELFVTDFPFFDLNGNTNDHHNGGNIHHSPLFPITTASLPPTTTPTTTTTTITTTTTTTPQPPPQSQSIPATFDHGSDALRTNTRQRNHSRQRPNTSPSSSITLGQNAPARGSLLSSINLLLIIIGRPSYTSGTLNVILPPINTLPPFASKSDLFPPTTILICKTITMALLINSK